ncbi:hypothetical protein ACFXPA_16550 [Amycolatopsis sp. NPDC059090]|uniref:hypothetical protein n=1 Tax=Amycolatopsis sp. NPDC059090 TaxID=3346723 RepID=UPI00366F0F0D
MSAGGNPDRLLALCAEAVERTGLDLGGRIVVTEAATGAYAVTPLLAAMAGASEVRALSRDSRYGTAREAEDAIIRLAERAGVAVQFSRVKDASLFDGADVVTNSGHLRPLDAKAISWLRPGSAVSLMYEPWELRPDEVDLEACHARGVHVAGPNEHHPDIGVFAYSGVMAVKQLLDAGVPVLGSRVLLLCDNVFASDIEQGITALGGQVTAAGRVDAVLVALSPRPEPVLDALAVERIREAHPGAVLVQFWGDIERDDLAVWPPEAPDAGHMGILPSAVGADPIVALQAGGLKVGELLTSSRPVTEAEEALLLRVVPA